MEPSLPAQRLHSGPVARALFSGTNCHAMPLASSSHEEEDADEVALTTAAAGAGVGCRRAHDAGPQWLRRTGCAQLHRPTARVLNISRSVQRRTHTRAVFASFPAPGQAPVAYALRSSASGRSSND